MIKRNKNVTDQQIIDTSEMTINNAAKVLKCGTATITRKRKALGIKSKKGRWTSKIDPFYTQCGNCEKLFETINNGSKFCCFDCYGEHRRNNPEQYAMSVLSRKKLSKSASKSWENPSKERIDGIEKRRNQNIKEYKKYDGQVRRMSDKVYEENKSIINPDGHKRTLCGVDNGYQLDHIKSIKECWNEGLSVEEASKIENLRIIPWKENLGRREFNTKWQ